MSHRFSAIRLWLVLGVVGLGSAIALKGSSPIVPRCLGGDAAPSILDDKPEPLTPQRPRTEADLDRVEALSLFAAGRMHERQEEYVEALRCYQRAMRYDPQSSTIARAIIPVAVRLKRYNEAIRYALKAIEMEDADPLLLRRLGGYLTEKGDWPRAMALFEKALATRAAAKETASDILLRMEMGRLYHLTEKYQEAADSFARVLHAIDHAEEFALDESLKKVLLGNAGPTYRMMGECFLAAGRPEEALAAFQKAEKVAPRRAMHQWNLARVHAKADRPTEALAVLETLFVEPFADEGLAPYETLAEVLGSLGRKDELLGRLEKLRADNPDHTPLGYFLAQRYCEAGQPEKAEALYLELLKKQPTSAGYRGLVAMYRKSRRFDALLAAMGEVVEKVGVLEAFGADACSLAGDAEAMRGIIETARDKIKSASGKFGYGSRLAVAMLALEAKQYETAGEFFDRTLDAEPKQPAEVFMAWGLGLLMEERAAEAARVFQRAIDEHVLPESNPVFHFYLAGALVLCGQTDDALAAARTAAEKNKDSARYRGRAAWVLYYAQRNDEAIKAYRELIDEFDADHASLETREVLREARLALSNLCVLQGDEPQAEEWLEQVLDEFPDDVGAMNDLGYLWAERNKHLGRARRLIQQAVDAEPDNMAYRDSLGWVLYRLERYTEAVAELEKAAAAEKVDGVVLDHLGDAYLKVNRRDKAAEAWRQAVEWFRKKNDAEKLGTVEKKLLEIAK